MTSKYTLSRTEVRDGILERAPWYQSIDFEEYGLSTTDDPACAFPDNAWDNKIDNLTIQEATRLRPKPKYALMKDYIPSVAGLDVLEIGSNCGFFSFQFVKAGANRVHGIEIAGKWLSNAIWVRDVLGLSNCTFQQIDFMLFDGDETATNPSLLRGDAPSIPLPKKKYDVVFTSTVVDHLFFPLFAIYKMALLARRYVVIDVPTLPVADSAYSIAKISVPADGSHHGFNFSIEFMRTYFLRLGFLPDQIGCFPYRKGHSIVYVLNCSSFTGRLSGA